MRFLTLGAATGLLATSCATRVDRDHKMIVSAADQRMVVYKKGKPIRTYEVSTSKYGLGDGRGTYRTPVGKMEVAQKIGEGARKGTVFKGRRPTGEVVKPNSPGRDPIVTRILWLRGKERSTKNAYGRYIYIHGTPEERNIGRPASYGCIRMRSKDIVDLYRLVGIGAQIEVVSHTLHGRPLPEDDVVPQHEAPSMLAMPKESEQEGLYSSVSRGGAGPRS